MEGEGIEGVEEEEKDGEEETAGGSVAPDANKKLTVRAALGALLRAIGRTLFVAILIIMAACVGLIPPYLLRNWIAELPPAGLAVGAAALLGVFKGAFQSLPTAWDYIVTSKTETLAKIFSQVAVVGLGLGFAWYSVASIEHHGGEGSGPLNLTIAGSQPPLVMNESDALLTTFVVFPEKKSEFEIKDPQFALMNNLVDSLLTCLRVPTDQIDVVVRAYASSSGNDMDNIALYKNRATYVSKLMGDRVDNAGKTSQFKIEIREWRSLKAMELRRLFTDTDESGVYQEKAGALNRRAEIKVHSAGSCLAG